MKFMPHVLMFGLALSGISASEKPNIIVYFTDDISAREFPIYGSNVWIDPVINDTSNPAYSAHTPVSMGRDVLFAQSCDRSRA